MKEHDAYYTPEVLADKLINYISEDNITSAVDFCVGDGKLLDAVTRRFPNVQCYGNDITSKVIETLREKRKDWVLSLCDFTDEESFEAILGVGDRTYDLIVLNPPFTCKGSTICNVMFDGETYHVSTAMRFIVRAMKYRAKNGLIYAILPSSCAYSLKDKKLWNYLESNYNLQVLEDSDRMYWSICSASIIMVSIGGQVHASRNIDVDGFDFKTLPIIEVIRGRISVHNASYTDGHKGVKYIHTTHMQGGKIKSSLRVNAAPCYQVQGPAVLIPRVCHPNRGKVCVYAGYSKIVPSDCVIVLRTATSDDASIVAERIIANWQQFVSIYQGTAAKYTNMIRVHDLFGL